MLEMLMDQVFHVSHYFFGNQLRKPCFLVCLSLLHISLFTYWSKSHELSVFMGFMDNLALAKWPQAYMFGLGLGQAAFRLHDHLAEDCPWSEESLVRQASIKALATSIGRSEKVNLCTNFALHTYEKLFLVGFNKY